MNQVSSIYAFGDTTFAIKTDGSLYVWGGYPNEKFYMPQYVRSGITAVAFMKEDIYQLLSADGQVFALNLNSDAGDAELSQDVNSSAIADNVRSVFSSGMIKQDDSLMDVEQI